MLFLALTVSVDYGSYAKDASRSIAQRTVIPDDYEGIACLNGDAPWELKTIIQQIERFSM
jgi:hypothetical protein